MWSAPWRKRICRASSTGSSMLPIRRPISSAASIASTAFRAAPSRRGITAAPTALSPTEAGITMTIRVPADRNRALRLGAALAGLSLALGACTLTGGDVTTVGSVAPNDYRLRHPIAIQEANHSIDVFVGNSRGGLSASQRSDVVGLAQVWLHEGTGAINADVPAGTPNARAAADTFREVRATLMAAGIPARGIIVRNYHPDDP